MRLIPAGNGESGMRKRNGESGMGKAEWGSGSESVEEAEEREEDWRVKRG